MVKKICSNCGVEFSVVNHRSNTAKYCCNRCKNVARRAKSNTKCSVCGKEFYIKPSQLTRYNRTLGVFCSCKCMNEAKKLAYRGDGNHQFGLKGHLNASFISGDITLKNHGNIDIWVYYPSHPYANSSGRVKKHRLVVEEYYTLFDFKYFEIINNRVVLKPSSCVHHLDYNHDNNNISNLVPCTRSEHAMYHIRLITKRDNKGRIRSTAVSKQGELLGTPEVDNQQPSQS